MLCVSDLTAKKTNVVLDKEVNGNQDVEGEGQMEK